MPYMGLLFWSYETLQFHFSTIPILSSPAPAWAGLFAGLFSKAAVLPLDVIRKRLQVQGPDLGRYVVQTGILKPSAGILGIGKLIVLQEGLGGLYKGLVPSLLKAGPSSAVTWVMVEWGRTFWEETNRISTQP